MRLAAVTVAVVAAAAVVMMVVLVVRSWWCPAREWELHPALYCWLELSSFCNYCSQQLFFVLTFVVDKDKEIFFLKKGRCAEDVWKLYNYCSVCVNKQPLLNYALSPLSKKKKKTQNGKRQLIDSRFSPCFSRQQQKINCAKSKIWVTVVQK